MRFSSEGISKKRKGSNDNERNAQFHDFKETKSALYKSKILIVGCALNYFYFANVIFENGS